MAGHGYLGGLGPRFDLNEEASWPTLFSAGIAALAGVLAGLQVPRAPGAERWGWRLAAGGLFFICIEEVMQIHELISEAMKGMHHFTGILSVPWIIPYGLLAVAALVIGTPFLRRIPAGLRHQLVFAAAIYLAGAIGFEAIASYRRNTLGVDPYSLVQNLLRNAEETMEMTGLVLTVRAFVLHLGYPTLTIGIASTDAKHADGQRPTDAARR